MKKQGKKNRIFAGIAAAVMAVSATAVGVRSYSANAADLELDNYAKLLQYSLYFYDANMCGDKVGKLLHSLGEIIATPEMSHWAASTMPAMQLNADRLPDLPLPWAGHIMNTKTSSRRPERLHTLR